MRNVASPFSLTGVPRNVKVGSPGDAAEHEANRVADQVASGPSIARPTISRLETMQRKSSETSDAEHVAQKAEEDHAPAPVQRAAAGITAEPTARKKEEESPPSLQRAEAHETMSDATAQRRCCGERGQNEQQLPAERPSGTASVYCKLNDQTPSPSENELNHSVRRKEAAGKPAGDLDAAATHAVATKDAGAPLRPHVLQRLESRMGADLSGVRVHEGSAAQESAAALQARAFTHKGDIWLGKGESQENTNLMAHEATHVVQQALLAAGPPIQRLAHG